MNVSIILPVFHEDKNIAKVLGRIKQAVKTSHEVLVIYDFPQDPTVSVVKTYLKKTSNRQVRLVRNVVGSGRGVLNAIKTGFAQAKGEAVVVMMADLSDDITQVNQMYQIIQQGYDIVCASRFMKEGKKIGGPLIKKLMARLASLSLKYVFGLPTVDATNAYKMYRKKVLDSITIESTGGFEYSLEIVLKAFKKGYRITEIPTVWKDRVSGKSNFKLFKWLPSYIKQYFIVLK